MQHQNNRYLAGIHNDNFYSKNIYEFVYMKPTPSFGFTFSLRSLILFGF